MKKITSDIAFTPAVKAIQERKGSRGGYAKMEQSHGWDRAVNEDLESFIAGLDMFYLGTASADGQPYIQHRGGPAGFLKVLDEHTLAFADFGGNRQYISIGNLSENPKAFIFLMDYATRTRIKLWGTARMVEGDKELEKKLSDPGYSGRVERVIVFTVEAWNGNCPQHIHKRYTTEQIRPVVEKLEARIRELEEKLAATSAVAK